MKLEPGLYDKHDCLLYSWHALQTNGFAPSNDFDKLDFNNFEVLAKLAGDKGVKLILPDGIKRIGDSAFTKCSMLKEIYLPESVKEIGAKAFAHCRKLKSIDLNNTVTEIQANTFYACNSLESVFGIDNVKEIHDNAFDGCTELKSINLENVNYIGFFAFERCENLHSVTFKSKITIDKNAFSLSGLESVVFAGKIKELRSNVFEACNKLKNIYILSTFDNIIPAAFPQNIENIYTFDKESLEKITDDLPKGTIKAVTLDDILDLSFSITDANNIFNNNKSEDFEK